MYTYIYTHTTYMHLRVSVYIYHMRPGTATSAVITEAGIWEGRGRGGGKEQRRSVDLQAFPL